MSGVASGLIGAVIAFGLITLAERTQKSAARSAHGWKVLSAGWFLNGLIVGGAAMAMLPAGVLLGGGSTLPDASDQNAAAGLLCAAFLAMTLYIAWITYRQTIMWKGEELRVRRVGGGVIQHRIRDATAISRSEMSGEYHVAFRNGATLRFSAHMHGADELAAMLGRWT